MTLFEHELAAIVAEIAEIDMDLISLDATLKEIGVDSLRSLSGLSSAGASTSVKTISMLCYAFATLCS